jgi:hypothetical protein
MPPRGDAVAVCNRFIRASLNKDLNSFHMVRPTIVQEDSLHQCGPSKVIDVIQWCAAGHQMPVDLAMGKMRRSDQRCAVVNAGDQGSIVTQRHGERDEVRIIRNCRNRSGIVRIAAVPSATVSLLPAVIEVFRRTHPGVRVEISDVDTVAMRRRVQRDEADIGILSARPGDTSDGVLILCDDLGVVCAEDGAVHAAHLKNDGRSDWSLLAQEPLIANPLCHLVDDPTVDSLLANSTSRERRIARRSSPWRAPDARCGSRGHREI